MSARECLICEEPLVNGSATTVVKEEGIKTLASASAQRKDGKAVLFKRGDTLELHVMCRKSYINDRMIAAAVKRLQQEGTAHVRSSRLSTPTFDFRTQCLICCKEIPVNYEIKQTKRPFALRDPVFIVKNAGVKDSILESAKARNDGFGRSVVDRLQPITDLKAVGGRYHMICKKGLEGKFRATAEKRGRKSDDAIERNMRAIYNYLENRDEDCQFTADELKKQWNDDDEPPVWKTVKRHLINKYGNDIIITNMKPPIICFKNTGYKIITDAWYQQRKASETEERRRIVETAAAIIAEDIRSKVYDTTTYPPPHDFFEGAVEYIPETLKLFTDSLILKKKRGDLEKWNRKSTALSHALITAVRPASFVSPVQLGLSAFLYKKFGSRKLVDVLSSLGFCSSYTETVRFEISCVYAPPPTVDERHFSQLVYDNADFNIQTLDGHSTFHVMGGILLVTPKNAILPGQRFNRLINVPSAKEVAAAGAITLKSYHGGNGTGLADVIIKAVDETFSHISVIVPNKADLVWLYSKSKDLPGTGGWNGFMEEVNKDVPHETTFVGCQQIINAPPSEYDTVYTSLLCAVEKCTALGQQTTVVTFDQPLFLKAREIVASTPDEFRNTVVRLGGFHLLMSFMGSIGYIMEGSGLSEMFNTIYAVNSTLKIMTGHSYARAIRAHYLAHRTLAHVVLQTMNVDHELHFNIKELLNDRERSEINNVAAQGIIQQLEDEFGQKLNELGNRGSTAKLWVQYFEMVTLVKQLIEAERKGDWALHLRTIYLMLPYFHSSGHFLYAKCAHLYLQDMLELQDRMPEDEYMQFTSGSAFTVRRSDRMWCGTFTDQTIEQSLMRSMKVEGGLTRSRDLSDSVAFRWLQGHTAMAHITEVVEEFCGIHFGTSEQHIDSRESRVQRDNTDAKKLLEWMESHYPFPDNNEIISISTGIMGDERVNCHRARELGQEGVARIVSLNFKTVKFRRHDRVNPLSVMHSGIKVHDKALIIDSTTLYQRMTIIKQSEDELKEFLKYELSPYPTSLFHEGSMRKGTKSSLYKSFCHLPDSRIPNDTLHVIDGGFLLHRVVWEGNTTFDEIGDSFIRYLQRHYSNPVVLFDGYPNHPTTKQAERLRRATKKHSVEVLFEKGMKPDVSQEHFLGNDRNKNRFISLLKDKLTDANIWCEQAEEDADRLIVTTAINLSAQCSSVTIVGEDIDLLVLLVGLSPPANVFLFKPGRGKVKPLWYHPQSLVSDRIAQNILFLHAVTGCDTTSALYGQGKAKSLKVLDKHPQLSSQLALFKIPYHESTFNQNSMLVAGESFLAALYGETTSTLLDDLRYKVYKTALFRSSVKMESLPPTTNAAHMHLLRVYLQVQIWLGHQPQPERFGWRRSAVGLQPILSTQPPAPEKLLAVIACKCIKGCNTKACSCKKAGLFCSRLCANCEAIECSNVDHRDPNDPNDDHEELDDDNLEVDDPEELPEPQEPQPGQSHVEPKRPRIGT